MRTLTWMPREPDVLGQPTNPWSRRTSFATSATWRTSSHATPGTGSRSTRSSSGWSRSSARTGCGFRSRQPRFTIQMSWAGIAKDNLVRRSPRRERQLDRLDPVRPRLGRPFLEERLAFGAVDETLESHRPAARPAQRAIGDREVVVDHVDLRVTRLREVDLLRIADRDDLAADIQLERLLGHVSRLRAGGPPRARPAPCRRPPSR